MRLLSLLLVVFPLTALSQEQSQEQGGDIPALLAATDSSVHTEQIATGNEEVVEHEVGLGAMRKVRGIWQFKNSARHDGLLSSFTWQVTGGFASVEVLEDLEQDLLALEGASLLFACDGRACGHANQWANRVFGQRLLYGKSDEQHYRVIAVENSGGSARVLLYSSARTADRQYMHADYLRVRGEKTP